MGKQQSAGKNNEETLVLKLSEKCNYKCSWKKYKSFQKTELKKN